MAFKSDKEFPSELCITGVLVGRSHDDVTYTSKKTGLQQTLKREVLILQCPFGIAICRSFNSQTNMDGFKVGETYCFPVADYKVDNGVKSFTVRI